VLDNGYINHENKFFKCSENVNSALKKVPLKTLSAEFLRN